MRIKNVSVTNLFGMFNHNVPLNLAERTTIIAAPNGLGKTVLFRMLQSLFSGKFSYFSTVRFDSFLVAFEGGDVIEVAKGKAVRKLLYPAPNLKGKSRKTKYFRDLLNGVIPDDLIVASVRRTGTSPNEPALFVIHSHKDHMEMHTSWGGTEWQVQESLVPSKQYANYEFDKLLDLYRNAVAHADDSTDFSDILQKRMAFNAWVGPDEEAGLLRSFLKDLPVHLIDSQRLLEPRLVIKSNERKGRSEVELTVERYAAALAEEIRAEVARYAELSQVLDREFPQKLIRDTGELDLDGQELAQKLQHLENKRTKLSQTGLLDSESNIPLFTPDEIQPNTRRALEIYIGDVERKLAVFDVLARKIEFFQRIINERFSYKIMEISKDFGFRFRTISGDEVLAAHLSTGEQHEVILFYDLLFNIDRGTLVLIDEPEISLHVAWQMEFLEDIQGVAELVEFDVLIATHSPQIINDRWDLTVELAGPSESMRPTSGVEDDKQLHAPAGEVL